MFQCFFSSNKVSLKLALHVRRLSFTSLAKVLGIYCLITNSFFFLLLLLKLLFLHIQGFDFTSTHSHFRRSNYFSWYTSDTSNETKHINKCTITHLLLFDTNCVPKQLFLWKQKYSQVECLFWYCHFKPWQISIWDYKL